MEKTEQLKNKLLQARALIDDCLVALGSDTNSKKIPKNKVIKKAKKKTGSTTPIRALVTNGFFKQAKTDTETQTALKKRAHRFERNDIAVTLMRLVKREELEREGSGTGTDPWKYKSK